MSTISLNVNGPLTMVPALTSKEPAQQPRVVERAVLFDALKPHGATVPRLHLRLELAHLVHQPERLSDLRQKTETDRSRVSRDSAQGRARPRPGGRQRRHAEAPRRVRAPTSPE